VNSLLLDETFLRQVSARLDRFKQTGSHHFNCRCPICGDSKRNRSKARFHAFEHNKKGFLVCKCFNCGYTNSFDHFLKELDPEVHKMYLMEKFRDANNNPIPIETKFVQTKPVFDTSPLKKLKKISQLGLDHPVRKWVTHTRAIPSDQHYRMYHCPRFKAWTNTVLPGKFDSVEHDEPRLLIPLFDEQGNMFGFQGRAFGKTNLRYITIMLDDSKPKIFGLDVINPNATVYCVEGPIDSMFINNSIASCGGDIVTDLPLLNIPKENIVIVYDNEPRNIHTIEKMEKAMDLGYSVCVWPDTIEQKDVNDMYLAGIGQGQIHSILANNTYQGLPGKLRMMTWKRV
jgi:hypothetical protein